MLAQETNTPQIEPYLGSSKIFGMDFVGNLTQSKFLHTNTIGNIHISFL